MQPTEQGRFCAGCQKTVVDYTSLSDRELVRLLAHASKTSCGRFRNEQLNRPLTVSNPVPAPVYRQWIGLLALSLFGWQTTRAQQNQANHPSRPVPTQQARPNFSVTALPGRTTLSTVQESSDREEKSVITGKVMITDSSGSLSPVPNAFIFIGQLGGTSQTRTDSLGTYRLSLPTRLLTSPLMISAHTLEAARGGILIAVSPSTKFPVADDIILEKPVPRKDITGGGIALLPTPSRWQKLKHKLFHASSRS